MRDDPTQQAVMTILEQAESFRAALRDATTYSRVRQIHDRLEACMGALDAIALMAIRLEDTHDEQYGVRRWEALFNQDGAA